VLRVAERYPEAEIELREAVRLEQASEAVGGEHSVSAAMLDLATVLLHTGRATEAVEILRRRLDRMLALGSAAATYEAGLSRLELAQALVAIGDAPSLAEARRLAEEVAAAPPGEGEELSAHDLLPSFVLARVDLAQGRFEEARQQAAKSLAIWKRLGREATTAAGEGRLLLGESLLGLGRPAEAEPELRLAFELLFRRVGAKDPRTMRARQLLEGGENGPRSSG
jgi:tetratricopeptide (TPR) repeat protein